MHRANVYNEIDFRLLGVLVTSAFYNSNYTVDRQTSLPPNTDLKSWSAGKKRRKELPAAAIEGNTGMRRLESDSANWRPAVPKH